MVPTKVPLGLDQPKTLASVVALCNLSNTSIGASGDTSVQRWNGNNGMGLEDDALPGQDKQWLHLSNKE